MSGGGGSSGIGSDVMGGLGLVAGATASLMGMPEVGIPMMMGGAGSLTGGLTGGGSGGGGGLMAPPMSAHGGGTSGGLAGLMGMGGPAGSSGPAPTAQAPMATPTSLAGVPAAPPTAALNPAGGGAASDPISGYLSAGGGGAKPVAIDPNALSGALNAPTQGGIGDALAAPNASTGATGTDPSQPWYSNPAYWQGAGSVGTAFLKFLTDQKQPEFARPFGSTVTPQQLNPLAGRAPIAPITPPQLVV